MISNLLDIDFIHSDVHDRSCKKNTYSLNFLILTYEGIFLHSFRMSFYEMSVDHSPVTKLKSSGLTVCTGTGSTSWYFNTNHVPQQSVKAILSICEYTNRCNVCMKHSVENCDIDGLVHGCGFSSANVLDVDEISPQKEVMNY